MWGRPDHNFAAVGNGRLALVHALCARPKIAIHFRHHGKHAPNRTGHAHNVPLRGKFRCRLPGVGGRPAENARDSLMMLTSAIKECGLGTMAAARSITFRTGVSATPMISLEVIGLPASE